MTNKEVLRCPGLAAAAAPGLHAAAARQVIAGGAGAVHEWDYVHQVPGRLRLRAAVLRRNRDRAEALESTVKAIEGVTAVAVNLLTGSLTVIYESARVTPEAILGVLSSHGFRASARQPDPAGCELRANAAARTTGRAVLHLVLEQMIERSVQAAIAALL